MKLTEIISNKKPSLSFEVFPPKTSDNFEGVKTATEQIAKLNPSYMSVTYGAGGGTSDYTAQIAKNLTDLGVTSLAHLTCISSTKELVHTQLEKLKSLGIENILALRGDIQEGIAYPAPDKYAHASELVAAIRELGDFCIGGACYPEGHPEAGSREQDIIHLKEKVDAGCDFLTTQMFFDNDLFRGYMDEIRAKGIHVPVLAGIMPVTNAAQLRRIYSLSQAKMPKKFERLVDKFGDKPEAMMQAGIAYAVDQIVDLIASGVDGIHIYTMNKPQVAAKIMDSLGSVVK